MVEIKETEVFTLHPCDTDMSCKAKLNKRQKLIADTSVTFITDQDSLFGDYFESDPDLKEYIIRNTSGVSTREIQPE